MNPYSDSCQKVGHGAPSRGTAMSVDTEGRLLRAALATADGWWEWNLDSDQAWYSQEFAELLGYDPAELPPRISTWHDLLHPADQAQVLRAIDTHLVGGPPFDVQFRMRTHSGEQRWFRCRGRCTYGTQRRPQLLSGNLQDIQTHKLLAQQGSTRAQQLIEQQRMDSLNTMAGGVAHEFNNLLQVMQGYVQCALRSLNKGVGDPANDLTQAQGAIDRAIKLNRDFLAFCRTGELEATTVDLNDTLTSLSDRLRPILPADISLTVLNCDQPLLVTVHEAGLHEALLNLTTNARDAMPAGGELTVRCYSLKVDHSNAAIFPSVPMGSYACLAVTDTGEGVDPQRVHRVWEPFYTTKGPHQGSGLGLAQVYGFAHHHQGTVGLFSRPQQGTTFRIYLPLTAGCEINTIEPSRAAPPSDWSILLLTADTLLADTLQRVVAPMRGTMLHVDCVPLLMANLEQYADRYDWVVLDGETPEATATEIRAVSPDARVACVTGFDVVSPLPFGRCVSKAALFDALIEKPFDSDSLLRSLHLDVGGDGPSVGSAAAVSDG